MKDSDLQKEDRPFYNEWVNLQELPMTEFSRFTGLDPEYLYVRLSSVLIFTILGGLALALFILLSSLVITSLIITLGIFVLLMGCWALLVYLEFKHRGYAIRSHDVAYRSGFLFRRRQFLPFRRIQHCKITEGLIERLFNFSTVIISAAGDDIVIHGLRPDEAQKLQQFVNEKVDELTKEMHYGRN